MSKKYRIINSNTNLYTLDECTIFNLLYIVLFFVIVFIIYKIIFGYYEKKSIKSTDATNITEGFKNISDNDKKSPQDLMNKLKQQNKELNTIKNTLQNKLMEQSQAIYLSQNFNKVNPLSFEDQLTYLLVDFADTKFPEIDMDKKKIVSTQSDLDTVLAEAKDMKNFYKPGEIVESNSTFEITKNNICYRQNNKPIKPTPEFVAKYPNCMVCEVEDDKNLKNTQGWKHTKTNISKVCLYNPNAEPNSGIPNLAQCKTFCNLKDSSTK